MMDWLQEYWSYPVTFYDCSTEAEAPAVSINGCYLRWISSSKKLKSHESLILIRSLFIKASVQKTSWTRTAMT